MGRIVVLDPSGLSFVKYTCIPTGYSNRVAPSTDCRVSGLVLSSLGPMETWVWVAARPIGSWQHIPVLCESHGLVIV